MIGSTPDPIPVTKPEVALIVKKPYPEELHVPPGVASLIVIVDETHTEVGPEIIAGNGFTVNVLNAKQPVGKI